AGDGDVAAHVLEVECPGASEPHRFRESLGVLRPARETSTAAAALALRVELLLEEARHLIGLALDVSCDLIGLTPDATGRVVGQVVPVTRLCRRHPRHGDEDEGKYCDSLDHAHRTAMRPPTT